MKKLMVALAVVAFAAVTQAAQFNWRNVAPLNAYNDPGDYGALVESGTMYLINAATMTQSAFFAAVLDAEDYVAGFNAAVAGAKSSALGADSEVLDGSFTIDTTAGTPFSFYTVMLDEANNGVYISEIADVTAKGVGAANVDFSHDAAYENSAFAAGASFSGAGWYTAESIPEPTSGLLMLLGMAGLALRRRRA